MRYHTHILFLASAYKQRLINNIYACLRHQDAASNAESSMSQINMNLNVYLERFYPRNVLSSAGVFAVWVPDC